MEAKRCSRCGQVKPLDEFSRNRGKKDGYSTWCLDCYKWGRERFDSLDATLYKRMTLADVIAVQKRSQDASYERVFKALGIWLRDKTLTPAQAEAIYLHAVEYLSYQEIGEIVDLHYTNVMYHYKRGIGRLRERYKDAM